MWPGEGKPWGHFSTEETWHREFVTPAKGGSKKSNRTFLNQGRMCSRRKLLTCQGVKENRAKCTTRAQYLGWSSQTQSWGTQSGGKSLEFPSSLCLSICWYLCSSSTLSSFLGNQGNLLFCWKSNRPVKGGINMSLPPRNLPLPALSWWWGRHAQWTTQPQV